MTSDAVRASGGPSWMSCDSRPASRSFRLCGVQQPLIQFRHGGPPCDFLDKSAPRGFACCTRPSTYPHPRSRGSSVCLDETGRGNLRNSRTVAFFFCFAMQGSAPPFVLSPGQLRSSCRIRVLWMLDSPVADFPRTYERKQDCSLPPM